MRHGRSPCLFSCSLRRYGSEGGPRAAGLVGRGGAAGAGRAQAGAAEAGHGGVVGAHAVLQEAVVGIAGRGVGRVGNVRVHDAGTPGCL